MNSILIVLIYFFNMAHPFHVSVCDVVVNQDTKSIQISQRVFLDDMEQTLNNTYGAKLIIDEESMKQVRDSLIELYLADRIEILIDGKVKEANYLGSEFEEDGIWCYIEIKGVKKLKELEITSSVLLDEFDDQANIIHFSKGDYEKSVKLDAGNPKVTFTIPKK